MRYVKFLGDVIAVNIKLSTLRCVVPGIDIVPEKQLLFPSWFCKCVPQKSTCPYEGLTKTG